MKLESQYRTPNTLAVLASFHRGIRMKQFVPSTIAGCMLATCDGDAAIAIASLPTHDDDPELAKFWSLVRHELRIVLDEQVAKTKVVATRKPRLSVVR